MTTHRASRAAASAAALASSPGASFPYRNSAYNNLPYSHATAPRQTLQPPRLSRARGRSHQATSSPLARRLLQYLEAPPWMRKSLFPVHEDLRMVGLVPALGCPHHATGEPCAAELSMPRVQSRIYQQLLSSYDVPADASGAYPREGVVVGHAKDGAGVLVRLGEGEEVTATGTAQEGTRVTVRAGDGGAGERGKAGKKRRREQAGLTVEPRGLGFDLGDSYRGYVVRVTRGLSGVLAEGPFENGYDWTVGTVESRSDMRMGGGQLVKPRLCEVRQIATACGCVQWGWVGVAVGACGYEARADRRRWAGRAGRVSGEGWAIGGGGARTFARRFGGRLRETGEKKSALFYSLHRCIDVDGCTC